MAMLQILDSSGAGILRLGHEVERFDFRLSTQDYVAVLGQDIEPPLAWDIRVARFSDTYNDLLSSGQVEHAKDALLGHSITGKDSKLRVNAARKQNAFSFVMDCEQAGRHIAELQANLDYVKVCWVLRIEEKRLLLASMGLLNVKARQFESSAWLALSRPTSEDQDDQ